MTHDMHVSALKERRRRVVANSQRSTRRCLISGR